MKKIIAIMIAAVFLGSVFTPFQSANAKAGKKITVKLTKCVDGDTAWFTKVGKSRFLYVDTPESTNKIQPFGKTASKYTCTQLKKAKKIQVQYDGTKKDRYGRSLVWVWVDGQLLQKKLVQKGYVKGFYDYGTYSYEKTLIAAQAQAKKKKVGIWSNPKKYLGTTTKAQAKTTTTKKTTSSVKSGFQNCTELRKVYPDGVPKGHPAYEAKMDRDKDNFACEK